ncbi:MAG: phage major capsid protein, partial [Candidatus Baldrarchaeia archaeon]
MSLDDTIKKAMGITLPVEIEKALISGDTGDFIPEEYANEFIDLVREKNWLRDLFQVIVMPAATFFIPKITGDSSVFYVSTEATAPTESKPAFAAAGSVRLDSIKLMGYVQVSNETDEDSRIAMMPIIKNSMAESIARAEEEAILNGQYRAYAADDPRSAFKGLLKLAEDAAQTTVADNADLIATIETARRKLAVHGRSVANLVLLVNPFTASQLRQLTQVLTVDKYGPGATILKGEVGKVMGITVVEEFYLPEDDTSAATYYAPVTLEKGNALLLDKTSPLIGDRRKVKFDQDKVVSTDSTEIAISERIGFTVQYVEALSLITG